MRTFLSIAAAVAVAGLLFAQGGAPSQPAPQGEMKIINLKSDVSGPVSPGDSVIFLVGNFAAQHNGARAGRQALRKPLGKHGRSRRPFDKPQILQRASVALEGANDTPLRSRAGRTIGATFDVRKIEARRAGDHLDHAGGAEVLRRMLHRS